MQPIHPNSTTTLADIVKNFKNRGSDKASNFLMDSGFLITHIKKSITFHTGAPPISAN